MLELASLVLKPGATPISHVFRSGRISVVLGRNRSGKTLLTRVLAGLETPAAGELRLDGETITSLPPGARPVSLVFQSFVNYPDWTVFENLASPLVAAGRDRAHIRARVTDIAGRLGLDDLLERYPAALSGGQQQRLAIGRALAKDARVLVMDEPLVNLDYKLREALQLELRSLLHQLDLCVVYTSSDPREALALADALLLMADHAVLQSGEPLVLYDRPVSAAAADLLCDPRANRLPGTEERLIRPEHLYLERRAADDVACPVTVLASETNGSETFLHCRPVSASGPEPWVARLDGLVSLPAGSRAELYAPAASILRFPGERAPGAQAGQGARRHG